MANRPTRQTHAWRAKSPADVNVEALARLTIVAWGRQPAPGELARKAESLRQMLEAQDKTRQAVLVAGTPDCPAGLCRTYPDETDPTKWWFAALAVDPACRRQGIGRALVQAALAYAQAQGAKVFRSQTHADNAPSIRFHEAMGFLNEGELVAPDGDRLIGFSRQLT